MNILFVYPTFVFLLMQLIINANCTNHDTFWKRAREGSIDLNRTPSPDQSIESNKASSKALPIEDITSTNPVSYNGCNFYHIDADDSYRCSQKSEKEMQDRIKI